MFQNYRCNFAGIAWKKSKQTHSKMRYLDKLIDELAKGKTMEKILRSKQFHTP
jgi:hypothetical protein